MGVAKDLEKRLEGLMEGFFTRVFRSGLQPVEVGRRLLREMEDGRTISVNRTYTPNEFEVVMGPDDFERFSKMEAGLQREFSDLVIDHAKKNRWNLMGTPKISFQVNESLGKGQFKVEASLAADPSLGHPGVSTREPPADEGASATRAISQSSGGRGPGPAGAELVVLGDDGEPVDRISIARAPITIGRMSTNDVVLSDSNVSRRHAELRRDGDQWMLLDLGSTNGSLVNGKLAREHRLSDGDKMSFGTTEMIFKDGV